MSEPLSPAPTTEVIVSNDEENLKGWIEYFKNLSTRIRVIVPSEKPNFTVFLKALEIEYRRMLDLEDHYELLD